MIALFSLVRSMTYADGFVAGLAILALAQADGHRAKGSGRYCAR